VATVRARTLLTAVAVLATVAVALPSTTAAKSRYRPCSGSFSPQGAPGGGFYRKITAKRVTCDTARAIARAWVIAHRSGSTNPTFKSVVEGFSCTGTAPSENVLKILCVREGGQKAVRFKGSP
jgi:hypothetical protein